MTCRGIMRIMTAIALPTSLALGGCFEGPPDLQARPAPRAKKATPVGRAKPARWARRVQLGRPDRLDQPVLRGPQARAELRAREARQPIPDPRRPPTWRPSHYPVARSRRGGGQEAVLAHCGSSPVDPIRECRPIWPTVHAHNDAWLVPDVQASAPIGRPNSIRHHIIRSLFFISGTSGIDRFNSRALIFTKNL